MKIVISGASGVIGSALVPRLRGQGHRVTRLVRGTPRSDGEVAWQNALRSPSKGFEGVDAVVHLGGESIMGRWTEAKKASIRASRIDSTRQIAQAIAALSQPPRLFLHASATGFYGERGDEIVDETSASGTGFLAEVCRDWESAVQDAREVGLRVVSARFGIVLTPRGGALPQTLTPFRWGLGASLGNGQQWWSWVSLEDAIGALLHALQNESINGPLNIVSPQPLTNREFTQTLAAALHRPALLTVPAFAIRAAMGQAGQEMLLSSQRVAPKVLCDTDFRFQHCDLVSALSSMPL